jgi:hypothetical protein
MRKPTRIVGLLRKLGLCNGLRGLYFARIDQLWRRACLHVSELFHE